MGQVDIDRLTKIYDDGGQEIVAVKDIDITIQDGEFLVLVGPSGCGKSTTLRCVAGLESVTDGRILLDGEDITHKKPMDRDIAMVFQNYALYPHMTARQNMSFGLKMTTSLSKEEIDESVEDTARMMGIDDLLEKKPGELSGGQQQRVALGRAIVRDPDVFLMDEPLSNLDAKLRTQMRTELQSLQQDLDVTTIYVTHDQTEAMTMGDRIAILESGELQQIGTPLKCYHSPNNRFVAGFIGSPAMNFFDGERDGTTFHHESFQYRLASTTAEQLGTTRELTLGIRPEDIELVDHPDENTISATVDVVEPMGDVTFLYLSIGDQSLTARVDGETVVNPQAEIEIRFPEDRLHVFDAESGEAVKNRETPVDESEFRTTV